MTDEYDVYDHDAKWHDAHCCCDDCTPWVAVWIATGAGIGVLVLIIGGIVLFVKHT